MKLSNYNKEFKSILNKYLLARKESNKNYSIGVLARQLGYKSKSTVSMILNGEREASEKFITKFMEHAKSILDETSLENIKLILKKKNLDLSEDFKFKLVTDSKLDPILFTIKELASLYSDEKSLLHAIENKLSFSIDTPSEYIKTCIENNYLKKNSNGEFEVTDTTTADEITNLDIQKYHHSFFSILSSLITSVAPSSRYVASSVLAFEKNHLEAIKKDIASFEDYIYKTYAADAPSGDTGSVGFFNLSFIDITKDKKNE